MKNITEYDVIMAEIRADAKGQLRNMMMRQARIRARVPPSGKRSFPPGRPPGHTGDRLSHPAPAWTGGHRVPRAIPPQRHRIPTPDEQLAILDCGD